MRLVVLLVAFALLAPIAAASLPGESLAVTLGDVPTLYAGRIAVAPVTVEYCYPAQAALASNGPTHVHLQAALVEDSLASSDNAPDAATGMYGDVSIAPTTLDAPVAPGAQSTCAKMPANLTITTKARPPDGFAIKIRVSANADPNGALQGGNAATTTPFTVSATLPAGAAPANATDAAPASAPKIMGLDKDLAYFLLGLLVTGAGALFGIWRLRSKRSRLRALLRAADETAQRLGEDALACEDALVAQRADAKKLLLDGRLDEGQYSLVEAHLDTLKLRARRRAVDHELAFLPGHVVKELNDVLADGRMSQSEHRRLAAALAAVDLAPHEAARATKLLDGWAARDSSTHDAAAAPTTSPRVWLRR